MTEIEKHNRKNYLKPPTPQQIEEFVKECGVSNLAFESFFGIPAGTIAVVKTGYMNMPVKYWHYFYEKIIPNYGVNYEEHFKFSDKVKPAVKKVPEPKKKIDVSAHSRLSNFK